MALQEAEHLEVVAHVGEMTLQAREPGGACVRPRDVRRAAFERLRAAVVRGLGGL
jgi:hypothetical protein